MTKILIVEDEPIQRCALEEQLSQVYEQKNIYVAETAEKGIAIIDKIKPDLVLLDIKLKRNSGFNVVVHIKTEYPSIKIIILTACNEFDFAHRAINLGISEYLLKPVRPAILIKKIDKALSEKTSASTKYPRPSKFLCKWLYLPMKRR